MRRHLQSPVTPGGQHLDLRVAALEISPHSREEAHPAVLREQRGRTVRVVAAPAPPPGAGHLLVGLADRLVRFLDRAARARDCDHYGTSCCHHWCSHWCSHGSLRGVGVRNRRTTYDCREQLRPTRIYSM